MNLLSRLRHWRIKTRLLLLMGIAAALMLALGAGALGGMRQLQGLQAAFIDGSYAASLQGLRLGKTLGDVRRFEKDMVISYEKPEQVAQYKQKWQSALKQVHDVTAQIARLGGDEKVLAETISARLVDYAKKAEPVVRNLEASGYDTATVANRMLAKAKEDSHAADEAFDKLATSLGSSGEASREATVGAVQRTLLAFGAALAAVLALMGGLTVFNVRSICSPIDEARGVADRIAAGDLTAEVSVHGNDEVSRLMQALAAMQDALRSLVGQLGAASASIHGASSEVASGNADLSSRTEQAAGSLQQTASSMEQLTGTVQQSAQAARQASELAATAASVAGRGGAVVAQVVSTMDEISASSRRIADIIGTIDGIAFQTNILALNAAVEAARAGEQGRGFAVVASEVRSLAQRSAGAAREIKQLIGASVERVETGTRLVADAGSTMSEIVASVERVAAIIGEISTTAAEQSGGIGQVNGAVSDLDRVTQQNAALVEQSAAAAESLKDQAERLASLVATFRLEPAQPVPA